MLEEWLKLENCRHQTIVWELLETERKRRQILFPSRHPMKMSTRNGSLFCCCCYYCCYIGLILFVTQFKLQYIYIYSTNYTWVKSHKSNRNKKTRLSFCTKIKKGDKNAKDGTLSFWYGSWLDNLRKRNVEW